METAEIKHLLNANNTSGLEALFNNYQKPLFKIAYYLLKDEEEAKDLVQELFLKVWSQRSKLANVDDFGRYLNVTVKHMAIDAIKKKKSIGLAGKNYLDLTWDPAESFYNEEFNEALKQEIRRFVSELPPKCRLIFSLHRFEGLTTKEIADHLQISPRTVEKQLSIGIKLLREKAKDRLNNNDADPMLLLLIIFYFDYVV